MSVNTIIEITQTYFKILGLSSDSKGGVSFCDIVAIHDLSDEDIVEKLLQWRKHNTHRLKKGKVRLIIPRKFAILRYLTLPSSNPQELKQMVYLQAINQVPYNPEDVTMDFFTVSDDDTGYNKVLVVIVANEILNRYANILEQCHFHLEEVSLSSMGISQWSADFNNKSDEVVALLNIDDAECEIAFCRRDGCLLSSRSFSFDAKENLKEFIKQLDLTLYSYKKEKLGNPPSRIYIYSKSPEIQELKELMVQEYGVETEIVYPPDKIAVAKNFVWPELLRSVLISVTAQLGVIRGKAYYELNLLPAVIKDHRQKDVRQRQLIKTIVLAFIALAGVLFAISLSPMNKNKYLGKLQDELNRSKVLVANFESKQQRLNFLLDLANKRIVFTDVVLQLYKSFPPGISLISLSLTSDAQLGIEGFTADSREVNQLQQMMVKSSYFENIKLEFVNKRVTVDGEMNYFKISGQIKRMSVNP